LMYFLWCPSCKCSVQRLLLWLLLLLVLVLLHDQKQQVVQQKQRGAPGRQAALHL